WIMQPNRREWEDTHDVLRAYLAEHPADDAEPVTVEKLQQVFNVNQYQLQITGSIVAHVNLPRLDRRMSLRRYSDSGTWTLWDDSTGDSIQWPIESWGDVRRLCAALGVELQTAIDTPPPKS